MQLGLSARGVGAAALLRQVAAKEGAQALMAGVAPRIAKRTLQVSVPGITVSCSAVSPVVTVLRKACYKRIFPKLHSAVSQRLDWMTVSHASCGPLPDPGSLYLQTALLWTIYEELRLVFMKVAKDR